MTNKKYFKIFFILGLALLFFDRISKAFFLKNRFLYASNWVRFELFKNYRFYFFDFNAWFYYASTFFALILFLGLFVKYYKKSKFLSLGFFLIAMGGASNLYDRINYGFVIDWIWIFILPISFFNIADILIAFGVIGCGMRTKTILETEK